MSSFEETQHKVIDWAKARQIIPNSTPMAQAMKGAEECAEWLQAATALFALNDVQSLIAKQHLDDFQCKKDHWETKFKDGIGDVLVCIVNSAALANVNVVECFELAYQEIKDRKGTMNANGIFVKDK